MREYVCSESRRAAIRGGKGDSGEWFYAMLWVSGDGQTVTAAGTFEACIDGLAMLNQHEAKTLDRMVENRPRH